MTPRRRRPRLPGTNDPVCETIGAAPASGRSTMLVTRIALENWRNFTRIDVPLQQRVFIAGPNAAGKSNLLDAFRFLRDITTPGGGLEKAVADRGGISKIRCLAARRYPAVVLDVQLGDPSSTVEWRYRLSIVQDNQRSRGSRRSWSNARSRRCSDDRTPTTRTTLNVYGRPTWRESAPTRLSAKSTGSSTRSGIFTCFHHSFGSRNGSPAET